MSKKITLALILLITTQSLKAAPQIATIRTSAELKSALGVVVSGDSFEKYAADSITRVSPDEVHITFSAPKQDSSKPAFVTAMAVLTTGEIVFSDLSLADTAPQPLPKCTTQQGKSSDSIPGTQSNVYTLLEIRGARREVLKQQLSVLTSKNALKELNSLERLFGLETSEPINNKTNSYELIDRLYRLKEAIKEMK